MKYFQVIILTFGCIAFLPVVKLNGQSVSPFNKAKEIKVKPLDETKEIFSKDGLYGVRQTNGTKIYINPVLESLDKAKNNNSDLLATYKGRKYILFFGSEEVVYYSSYCSNCDGSGYTTTIHEGGTITRPKSFKNDTKDYYTGETNKTIVTYNEVTKVAATKEQVRCTVCHGKVERGSFTWDGSKYNAVEGEVKLAAVVEKPAENYKYYLNKAVPEYHDGLAVVEKDKRFGYINEYKRLVIPLIYDYASNFSEGMAGVNRNGKWGFVDLMGTLVVPVMYDEDYSGFSNGLAAVRLKDKWGFIDKTGKTVIPFTYDAAMVFREGLVAVKLNDKWGYIDLTGKIIVPLKYDCGQSFSGGIVLICINKKYGYINKKGDEIIPPVYDNTYGLTNGIIKMVLNDHPLYFDKSGKVFKDAADAAAHNTYEHMYRYYEGLAAVDSHGKFGYIDVNGKEVIPLIYDQTSNFTEGLAAVKLNGKWGCINKTGAVVIPFKYEYISDFKQTIAAAQAGTKWGFINKYGKEVVPFIYDAAWGFSNDKMKAQLKGQLFYFDVTGKMLSQ